MFRRPWPSGSFSIEASFAAMRGAFPADAEFELQEWVSPWPSQGVLPRLRAILAARRVRADIYHVTGDVHFLVLGLPRARTLLTIHDCGLVLQRRGWRRWVLRWFWLVLPVWWVRRVTTVSEATKRDVVALSGCHPDKVVVVPTTVSSRFVPVPAPTNPVPVVLHIGTTPNKNLARHIAALQRVACHLRVIGRLDAAQWSLLRASGLAHDVHADLDDAAMRAVYASADVLLFASTLEGFGMPILEAQATGRPVVTSQHSSMPEVAGDAACFVDAFDVDAIRAGVRQVLENAPYRAALVSRGVRNVERFSPARIANAYASIYRALHEECHRAPS